MNEPFSHATLITLIILFVLISIIGVLLATDYSHPIPFTGAATTDAQATPSDYARPSDTAMVKTSASSTHTIVLQSYTNELVTGRINELIIGLDNTREGPVTGSLALIVTTPNEELRATSPAITLPPARKSTQSLFINIPEDIPRAYYDARLLLEFPHESITHHIKIRLSPSETQTPQSLTGVIVLSITLVAIVSLLAFMAYRLNQNEARHDM